MDKRKVSRTKQQAHPKKRPKKKKQQKGTHENQGSKAKKGNHCHAEASHRRKSPAYPASRNKAGKVGRTQGK